jgi:excisionase family DNA binding protein
METNKEQKGISAKGIKDMLSIKRITKKQAADYLSVSTTTIQNYVKQGRLSVIKMGASKQSKVYFKLEEILELLKFTSHINFDQLGNGVH